MARSPRFAFLELLALRDFSSFSSVVEQYRLLDGMIMIIKTVDERTGRPVCNPDTCPTMSAAG